MTSSWPPDGYQQPVEYETNDRRSLVLAIVFTPIVLLLTFPMLDASIPAVAERIIEWNRALGFHDTPIVFLIGVILSLVAWIIGSALVLTLVHEIIHYLAAMGYGLPRHFRWSRSFGFPNPGVAVTDVGSSRTDHIVVLIAPFFVLDTVLATIILSGPGFVAATAIIMFAVNTVASSADIDNTARLIKMPSGTQFANWIKEGRLHTEVAYPEE